MRSKRVGRCARWGALLLCVSLQAVAASGEEAQRLLRRVSEAANTQSYEGVFIYRHGGDLETLRVLHRADPDGVHERIYALTGEAREIVRDAEKVICILPDSRAVLVDRRQLQNPFESLLPADIEALERVYQLEVEGSERVADRESDVVAIRPRDEFRYGYRLWVDRATGLLLRADLVNELGESVEQLMFTELKAPAEISDEELKPVLSGEGFTWYRSSGEQPAAAEAMRWRADALPAGFQLAMHEVREFPGGSEPVEHFIYSDGLASVSVYVEPNLDEEPFTGHSRMGALNAYGHQVDGHQVTVVGEVPAATVVRIAESIRKESAQ